VWVLGWIEEAHDGEVWFCFEWKWNWSPPAPAGMRTIELESPFYWLYAMCEELGRAVQAVFIKDDPLHVGAARCYRYQPLSMLPDVEETVMVSWLGRCSLFSLFPWEANAERVL
jgi:hypothetical protein